MDIMTQIALSIFMCIIIIYHIHRLRWFKKNFDVIEAVCVFYVCGRGSLTGYSGNYHGTYEYYVDGIKYIEEELKTSTASMTKPRLNEKCYVYVSKNNPKNILPYSQREDCIRMIILCLWPVIGMLIYDVLSIIGFW